MGLFIGSIITGIYTFLVNPGVTFKEKDDDKNNENLQNFNCQLCKFTYPKNKKYQHCFSCSVCIPNSDHHCGIFGKCIGYKNKVAFYLCPTFCTFISISFLISIFYYIFNEILKKKDNNEEKL